jgi:phosphatidylglycerol:prolipoprotein diacylglycerol transferase
LVAPILALGEAIARIGCLLNGCCYGYITNLPWALPCAFGDDALRHPTQIYAVFSNLILFAILWSQRDRVTYKGQLALHYVILYSIFRFVVEIWRESQLLVGPIKTTQAASVVLILIALLWDRWLLRQQAKEGTRG